ncbi:MAG: MarR family transcriptional regulator [Planctomycetes bacterium]|nr:MarR family transcriptional regulator [Planctomycetota bacterium]
MTTSASTTNQETQPADGFIRLWGEMGTHWGVPRTMTQVHALLFIEGRSLNTDDIMTRLSISRGNASMTLRTLVDWGMITRTHNPRDRKDYYAAEQDVWRLFATIARARKRREIEPLLGSLKQVLDQSADTTDVDAQSQRTKIEEVLAFTRLFDAVTEQFLAAGPGALGDLAGGR